MDLFDGDAEGGAVEYEPIGVKDLLVAMKNSSELIVDLAYSALLHNSDALAEEVLELEAQMDILQLQARMNMLMAARTTTDAKQLAPVLGMIGAAEKISEAAGDMAHLVLSEDDLPWEIRSVLPEAMEVLARAELDQDSPYSGRTLGDIDLETETGVRVIAIRGETEWKTDPDYETTLQPGDVLLLRSAEANLAEVYERVTGEPYETPVTVTDDDPASSSDQETHSDPEASAETEPAEKRAREGQSEGGEPITDLERAVDTIVLMKNVSELSVDLAYASILFDDEELAQEVRDLEVEVDALQARLEAWTLRAASEMEDPVSLRSVLRIASSAELISDAALEISEGILRDIDTHPVIAESVRESDVAVRRVRLRAGSKFAGAMIEDIVESHPGVAVIAIHRADEEWVFYPEPDHAVEGGDALIARGTWNATDELLEDAT